MVMLPLTLEEGLQMTTPLHIPAPEHKVFFQTPSCDDAGHFRKGLCLFCGDRFNLKPDYHETSACPECYEIFEDGPEYRLREAV